MVSEQQGAIIGNTILREKMTGLRGNCTSVGWGVCAIDATFSDCTHASNRRSFLTSVLGFLGVDCFLIAAAKTTLTRVS